MNQEQREISAKNLLENPLFIEAFGVVEEELLTLWKTTGSIDIDQREAFWLALRLLERLKGHISSVVETGVMAKMLEKQHPYI
jgi:hypothetical protein